ncbi:MAG: hypothetical protein Q8O32_01565, partial [bacterium]|nr:hypothetical protein [bacterium]
SRQQLQDFFILFFLSFLFIGSPRDEPVAPRVCGASPFHPANNCKIFLSCFFYLFCLLVRHGMNPWRPAYAGRVLSIPPHRASTRILKNSLLQT